MNTQGIGKQDSWAQFMKLTQDARLRNTGFAEKSQKVSSARSTTTDASQLRPLSLSLKGISYSSGEPEVKKVILGGKFDAYA